MIRFTYNRKNKAISENKTKGNNLGVVDSMIIGLKETVDYVNDEGDAPIVIMTDGDPNNSMDLLIMAEMIAESVHAKQKDKGGHPYMDHINAVVNGVYSIKLMTVAYLHDTIEDGGVTAEDLKACFPEEIVETVDILTRKQGMSYGDYIENIMENKAAVAVKMSDMRNNMDLSRIKNPSEKDFERLKKYEKHYKRLERAYHEFCEMIPDYIVSVKKILVDEGNYSDEEAILLIERYGLVDQLEQSHYMLVHDDPRGIAEDILAFADKQADTAFKENVKHIRESKCQEY